MRKYSDIFMSVPVSGGYKLKNFSELNGDIERILRMLIWKRVWFLVAAVCAPLFMILITIMFVIVNAV